MRTEEADGPLEPVLATAVSRTRWAASHALTALLGATVLLLLFGTGVGVAAGGGLGDPARQGRTPTGGRLGQLPGVLVVRALGGAPGGPPPPLPRPVSLAGPMAPPPVRPPVGPPPP